MCFVFFFLKIRKFIFTDRNCVVRHKKAMNDGDVSVRKSSRNGQKTSRNKKNVKTERNEYYYVVGNYFDVVRVQNYAYQKWADDLISMHHCYLWSTLLQYKIALANINEIIKKGTIYSRFLFRCCRCMMDSCDDYRRNIRIFLSEQASKKKYFKALYKNRNCNKKVKHIISFIIWGKKVFIAIQIFLVSKL